MKVTNEYNCSKKRTVTYPDTIRIITENQV